MTVNIPRMVDDHALTTIEGLDQEIESLVAQLTKCAFQRAQIIAHKQLQDSFTRFEPSLASVSPSP